MVVLSLQNIECYNASMPAKTLKCGGKTEEGRGGRGKIKHFGFWKKVWHDICNTVLLYMLYAFEIVTVAYKST